MMVWSDLSSEPSQPTTSPWDQRARAAIFSFSRSATLVLLYSRPAFESMECKPVELVFIPPPGSRLNTVTITPLGALLKIEPELLRVPESESGKLDLLLQALTDIGELAVITAIRV